MKGAEDVGIWMGEEWLMVKKEKSSLLLIPKAWLKNAQANSEAW